MSQIPILFLYIYICSSKQGGSSCRIVETKTHVCPNIENGIIIQVERETINKNEYMCYMAVQLATISKCLFLQSGENIPW